MFNDATSSMTTPHDSVGLGGRWTLAGRKRMAQPRPWR